MPHNYCKSERFGRAVEKSQKFQIHADAQGLMLSGLSGKEGYIKLFSREYSFSTDSPLC